MNKEEMYPIIAGIVFVIIFLGFLEMKARRGDTISYSYEESNGKCFKVSLIYGNPQDDIKSISCEEKVVADRVHNRHAEAKRQKELQEYEENY